MLKKLFFISILILSLPFGTKANFTIPFSATSTTQQWVFPSLVNNVPFTIFANSFYGSSTKSSVFPYASTTALSASALCLTGDVCRTTWPSGAVSSVSNSDSSLTISPTTGSVVASINTSNNTTWAGTQTFNNLTVNGTCTGCGSGSVTSALQGQNAYYNAAGTTVVGTSTIFTSQSNTVGISMNATSSPWAQLSVSLPATSTIPFFVIASTTNGISQQLLVLDNLGFLRVGSNAFVTNITAASSSASNLDMGNISADTDAGAISWMDLPLSSAANNALESYTANINTIPMITVFGYSGGGGSMKSSGVGIGSTTPSALLSIVNNTGILTASSTYELIIASSTSASANSNINHFVIDNKGNIYASSTAPTLTNASWAVVGDNGAGTINAASSPATITFAIGGYTSVPSCTVTEQTGSVVNVFSYTVSATAIVITQTGLTGNVDYICRGHSAK